MLFQTKYASGAKGIPVADCSGDVVVATAKHTFSAALTAATDQIELFVLPANHRVVDMTVVGDAAAAITANIGIMSGAPGDGAATRTVGTEFFSAVSLNGVATRASLLAAFRQAPSNVDRLIGATISADVAASGSKTLEVIIYYAALED